jgi:hypothetical protein
MTNVISCPTALDQVQVRSSCKDSQASLEAEKTRWTNFYSLPSLSFTTTTATSLLSHFTRKEKRIFGDKSRKSN